jgi:hypothetical protein
MSKPIFIVAVASWEQRFLEGIKRDIDNIECERVVLFYYSEYTERTASNRAKIRAICETNNIIYEEYKLSFLNTIQSWKHLCEVFLSEQWHECSILFDISTAPREAIWNMLYLMEVQNAFVEYVYHRPVRYSDWLSREPGKPRLIYRQSGIMQLGRQTCLLIVTGFDTDRTFQLINYYEPKYSLIAFQSGSQYANERENVENHLKILEGFADYETFDISAYSKDHGYSSIKEKISPMIDNYNILATSIGPKPSSIALYKLRQEFPSIGLVYTPSYEFNEEYSVGIAETISGSI